MKIIKISLRNEFIKQLLIQLLILYNAEIENF